MISVIIIYAVISIISLIFMLFLMLSAPNGWEDKDGFHLGQKNVNDGIEYEASDQKYNKS